MERVITSLNAPLIMRYCTVAPLSADVTFSMAMMDGFGPETVSGDVILSKNEARVVPNRLVVAPITPGKLIRFHVSTCASVVLQ